MSTLSSIDQSSYFPMDGNAEEWNGRQIGYLIGRSYQTVERQVSSMGGFFSSARYEEVKHKLIKGSPAAKSMAGKAKLSHVNVVSFSVRTLIMSRKDWISYLLMFKNDFQTDLIKQLRAGWSFDELRIEHKRVVYGESK